MQILVLSFIILLGEAKAFACEATGTKIYFGNGMFNSMNDVQNSLVEMKRMNLNSIESNPNQISFGAALNLSETDLDNILSVVHERADGDLSYFWEALEGIIPLPEWLDEPIQKAIASNIHSETLSVMLSEYENDFANGRKVILLSHSQGNFYAEEAAKELTHRRGISVTENFGFGNVRVATPTQTHFTYPYFTFQDDFIIELVRLILNVPYANLPFSGAGLGPELDPHGHDFVRAYLAEPDSQEKIRRAVVQEALATQSPCQI